MTVPNRNPSEFWKERFRTPEILYARIATQNPARGFISANIEETYQLYAWDVQNKKVHPVTDLPGGVMFALMLSDGRGMIYLRDVAGEEIGHYHYVSFDGSDLIDLTPELDKYSRTGLATASHSNHIAMSVGFEDRFSTYLIDDLPTEGYQLDLIYASEDLSGWPCLSHDGRLIAIHTAEQTQGMRFSIVVLETSFQEQVANLFDGETCSIECVGFSPEPNDERLLAYTDRSGYVRPLVWDPNSGSRVDFELPDMDGDVKPLDWMPGGKKILVMQVSKAEQRLYMLDLDMGSTDKLIIPSGSLGFGGGVFGHEAFFTPDGRLFALMQDAQTPGHIVELDPITGESMNDILCLKQPPPGHAWESIELMSSGDFKIQVWLGKPVERTPPYPTIIHTHGGPEAVMTNEFHASAQAWLDHGYAFLTINYRGSTTFGKDFKECIWGHPGTLEVEDILSARKWLINSGIAHPEQIFLTGYSYGGFLTLLAMGKTPGCWSGGMALAAVSDFVMSYEFQNPILKAYDQKIFHGSPEENPEAWKAASPITYAESFDAPILIIQGSNDSRTPAEPIRVFEKKLITLGKDIQVHWYEAGHIGPTKEQWIEFQQLMMDFADKILIK